MGIKKALRGEYYRDIYSSLVALSVWKVMTLLFPHIACVLKVFLQ